MSCVVDRWIQRALRRLYRVQCASLHVLNTSGWMCLRHSGVQGSMRRTFATPHNRSFKAHEIAWEAQLEVERWVILGLQWMGLVLWCSHYNQWSCLHWKCLLRLPLADRHCFSCWCSVLLYCPFPSWVICNIVWIDCFKLDLLYDSIMVCCFELLCNYSHLHWWI